MCSADVGIVTYEWVKYCSGFKISDSLSDFSRISFFRGFDVPYPDFNDKHQCRNLDKILLVAWAYENYFYIPRSRSGGVVDRVDAP